jgi:hypothetical protein
VKKARTRHKGIAEPYPRPVPRQWIFILLTDGFHVLLLILVPLMAAAAPVLYMILNDSGLDVSLKFALSVTVCIAAGLLLLSSTLLALNNARKINLLRYGKSIMPEIVSSSATGATREGPVTVYRGWDIIDTNSDVPIYRKKLKIETESGDTVIIKRTLPEGDGPVFLFDPKNVRNHVGIDELQLQRSILIVKGEAVEKSENLLDAMLKGKSRGAGAMIFAAVSYTVAALCVAAFLVSLYVIIF